MNYICLGLLGVFAVFTLSLASRDWDAFADVMKVSVIVWIVSGAVCFVGKQPLTFASWFVGGGVVCLGGGALVFDVIHLILNHEPREPKMEVIEGEVMPDLPALPAPREVPNVKVGNGPFGPVIKNFPFSDWQSCRRHPIPHWHRHVNGRSVCEWERGR